MDPSEDASCIFNLSVTPSWGGSFGAGRAGTLTATASTYWVPSLARWMLAKELAALSGFPVTQGLAARAGISFDSALAESLSISQIGNAMVVPNAGVVVAVALSCLRAS